MFTWEQYVNTELDFHKSMGLSQSLIDSLTPEELSLVHIYSVENTPAYNPEHKYAIVWHLKHWQERERKWLEYIKEKEIREKQEIEEKKISKIRYSDCCDEPVFHYKKFDILICTKCKKECKWQTQD